MARSRLDSLFDLVFELEQAVGDVERTGLHPETLADAHEAIDWLVAAARPLVDLRRDEEGEAGVDPQSGPE